MSVKSIAEHEKVAAIMLDYRHQLLLKVVSAQEHYENFAKACQDYQRKINDAKALGLTEFDED